MNNAFELIPFTIEIVGEVRENNLAEVMPSIREWLESINRNPQTDEEFGDAELDVKRLAEAEKRLKEAKDKALADASSIQELFKSIEDATGEIREARLELEKVIANEKEKRKADLVEEALATFDIDPMDARKFYLKGLQESMKGKRTLDSMKTALRIYATTQQGVITANRKAIETFEKAHGQDMTMDRRELEVKSAEFVTGELRRRFEAKKAADERKRLEAEAVEQKAAAAKAQAELEASKQPAAPAPLPTPPKIGTIPTGSKAPVENVVPFQSEAPVMEPISDVEEWKQFSATVYAAFALIKEHRERLRYSANVERAMAFGQGINPLWKAVNSKEVAS
jgi:hypothetical protein